MNYAIYSRKSVYTGKGESIENQIEMCKQYIFTKFTGVTDADITVYEDEGFSAKNIDRPQFRQMLADIKQKRFDFVVCYRLDRISRNVSDFSALIEDLNDREISFICIKEEFDTSKPMGKAMMYIASVFAQLERETIAERVRDNMLMLARTGRWLGGTTPMGFTSEKTSEVIIDGKVKTSCKLKTESTEIAIVKIMFEKFIELHSVSGVSKYLIKQNIKSRAGKMYSLLGIKEILQNPVYCFADIDALNYFIDQNADVCFEEKDCSKTMGLISYNKRDYKKKHAPRQPIEKWIISIGKHKGVIPGKDWVTVQKILESNKPDSKRPAKMHNDYSLLSGLIFCEKCESKMFAKSRGKSAKARSEFTKFNSEFAQTNGEFAQTNGEFAQTNSEFAQTNGEFAQTSDEIAKDNGEFEKNNSEFAESCDKNELFDYICQSKMRGGTNLCDCQNLGGQQTDDAVCEYLMNFTNETSDIYRLLEKLKKDLQENKPENTIPTIKAQIKKCNDEMDNLVSSLSQNNLGQAFISRINVKITELDRELKRLTEEQNQLQSDITASSDKEIQIDMIAGALSSLKENFRDLSIHEKRTLIKLLVQKIIWDGRDLHIFLYGE